MTADASAPATPAPGTPPKGRPGLAEALRIARAFVADGLALFGFLLVFVLYITPGILHPNVFVQIPNAFLTCAALIVGCLPFVGGRALGRTPMDTLFVVWMLLAAASHVYALSALNRDLPELMLYTYVVFIATAWISFRAGYAVVKVTPAFGPIALLIAIIFTLMASAALGILQSVGPVKVAALEFGQRFSGAESKVLEGAAGGRATGVFGGPNILGYANDIGAICLVGIGAAYARAAKPLQVALIMAGLGIFGYSTLLAQSRISLGIFVLTLLAYGLILRRFGATRNALAVYVALLFGVVGVGAVGFQVAKLDYVAGTFQNDISKDSSLLVRQMALQQAANIAVDVAPLGSGVGQINQVSLEYERGYDPYWTFGVDNEWVNIYLTHGVWGPLLMAVYYFLGFVGAARARRSVWVAGRTIGYVATACLCANLAISFTGVRLAKYESAIYTNVVLGAAFASAGDRPRRPLVRRKAAA